MPSVAQVSSPVALTPATISHTLSRSRSFGSRHSEHGIHGHQLFRLDAGVVVHALGTIGTVLRATAGLDREQGGNLHLGGIEMAAVNALGVKDQLGERKREQRPHLVPRPVVADDAEADIARVLSGWSGAVIHARTLARGERKSKPGPARHFSPPIAAAGMHAGGRHASPAAGGSHRRRYRVWPPGSAGQE